MRDGFHPHRSLKLDQISPFPVVALLQCKAQRGLILQSIELMKNNATHYHLAILFFFILSSCTQRSKITDDFVRQQDRDVAGFFSDSLTDFSVDVYYEASSPPYTGALESIPTNTAWDITLLSFKELFKTHTKRTVTVPHELVGMKSFPDRMVTSWDEKQLIQLAASMSRAPAIGQQIASVFFLRGTYMGQSTVLGIHFSGYKAAFIFKDNLTHFYTTATFLQNIEQATVVHELGHVIGLVNNGLPMKSPHEDSAHPHHSTDPKDVMYWDLVAAVTQIDQMVLFGPQSLSDGQGFHTP